MKVKDSDGLMPTYSSAENKKGRMYNEPPSVFGIHSRSKSISVLSPSMNNSSGTLTIAMRSAEIFKRFKLSSGRKTNALP
jgi:hypothetical protein